MKKFLIIRHGKTTWNQQKRLQGSGSNSPLLLTSEIKEDYQALGYYLKLFKVSAIYSSPIERAKKTAELATKTYVGAVTAPIKLLPELVELSFGSWEGKAKDELITKYPAAFKKLSLRKNDAFLEKIGVENFDHARQRFCRGLQKINHLTEDGQTVLIVSHGAISQLGIKQLTGNEQLGGLANLSVSVICFKNQHYWIEKYNETGFLKHPVIQQQNTSIS
ncbi:histidine phosphatase family protein [Liquorilactobacillus sicerae]|uniref:histidine phosphatase family protein n=1 Tax=Liquorilactobacillus sicerae TaxID=1416943 RepID=UPI002480F85F|nr:histidine phosphatase family protein [Liquorilactobacillus sicerae]